MTLEPRCPHGWRLSRGCDDCVRDEAEAEVPPLAQDERALAQIEAYRPIHPYPLGRPRRDASTWALLWYLLRLAVWRALSPRWGR